MIEETAQINQPNEETPSSSKSVLIMVIFSLTILGFSTLFYFLSRQPTRETRRVQDEVNNLGSAGNTIGSQVNENKALTAVEKILIPEGDTRFLVRSSLKNSYTGFVVSVEWKELETLNDQDVALVLEMTPGAIYQSHLFSFTKSEVENMNIWSLEKTGLEKMDYRNIIEGYGVTITRIIDLIKPNPDELILEVVKNPIDKS